MSGEIKSILATDCGSTTTKAILIEKEGNEYRLKTRGEAPTTVEAPFEDVTCGVLNAVAEIEELRGRKLIENGKIITPQKGDVGVDAYVSTSSAGGGLQMMVAGVVKSMTGESAQRAALGAGSIVMDVLASNDGRMPHQKIERIRTLRPDMILLAGGEDGGTVKHVLELAELIQAAKPQPRLGQGYNLPIIYAGNKDARSEIKKALDKISALFIVENIRPKLEMENLKPARDKIHELFMEHVMQQAPGYNKLMDWVREFADIMPTPGAVGLIMQTIAEDRQINVLGVDIGGATTDVFSVFDKTFNRTVSANLGMSYSVSNVMAEAGYENVMRWVPFPMDEEDLRNRIANKMIRPTTIPQSREELMIEQAIAREALRLAFLQHKEFAVKLKGIQQERNISDAFRQTDSGNTLVDMMALDLLVGSGGVLSHAPRRAQSAQMMIDAYQPEGVTELAVDSIFMMPQLGVLTQVDKKAATEVFEKDCIIHLGFCIAPKGQGKPGKQVLEITGVFSDGTNFHEKFNYGELKLFEMPLETTAELELKPSRGFDVGGGAGNPKTIKIHGGVVGLMIDTRGRPMDLSINTPNRIELINQWKFDK